jgi:hypothetical protein
VLLDMNDELISKEEALGQTSANFVLSQTSNSKVLGQTSDTVVLSPETQEFLAVKFEVENLASWLQQWSIRNDRYHYFNRNRDYR